MENLEQRIYDKIFETMDLEPSEFEDFTYDSPIFKTDDGEGNLGLDSLDYLELMLMIEKEWGLDIPEEDTHQLRSVRRIANYVRAHVQ